MLGSFLFHALFFLLTSGSSNYSSSSLHNRPILSATLNTNSGLLSKPIDIKSEIETHKDTNPESSSHETGIKSNSSILNKGTIPIAIPDRPAKILELGKIDIPIALSDYSGSIILDVEVNEQGKIRAISIVYSNPPIIFDEIVQSAIMSSKVEQAIQNGKPVTQIIRLEINFVSSMLTIGGKEY